ncbi:hypothetical protein B0H13DRAFT_2297273, partial [Mycena leptocephala]
MLCSMLFICAQVLWLLAVPVNLPGWHACYSRRTLDAKYGCCPYPYLSLSVMSAEGETCLRSFVALKIVDSYLGHSDCPVITCTPTICPRPSISPSITFTLGPECSWYLMYCDQYTPCSRLRDYLKWGALRGYVALCLCESGATGSGITNISHVVSCFSGSWATGSRTTNHSHVALLGDVAKCLCESGAAGSGTTKISYIAECLSGSEAAGSGTTMISYVAECLSGSEAARSGTTTNFSYVAECLSGSKAAGSGTTIISYVTLCLSGSEAAGSGITTNCIKWNAGNGKNKNKWNAAS